VVTCAASEAAAEIVIDVVSNPEHSKEPVGVNAVLKQVLACDRKEQLKALSVGLQHFVEAACAHCACWQ